MALSRAAAREQARLPGRCWQIAWLLGLGVLVNYLDRVNLSVSYRALVSEFGISSVVFGYLSGAYNMTYAACQLPVGVLLDRFGVRRVGRTSTLLWSAASFGAAIAPTVPGLFAARFLLGVGEAPTFPANAKAVSLWFPAHTRSFATAIFDAAAKFSSVIGVPLLGVILLGLGWRLSFALTGLASLLYFLLFWLVYRDPAEDPTLSPGERGRIASFAGSGAPAAGAAEEPESLGFLLGRRKVLGLAIGFGSYNYVFYLLLTWLPTYLSERMHVDLLHSYFYTSMPWMVATLGDLLVGGWLVDHLIRRGHDANRVRRTVLLAGMVFGLGILGASHASTALGAIGWISLSIGGLSAQAPVGWSIPSLIVGRGNVGRVGGIMNFANQLSGLSAPIVTGYLVHARMEGWVFGIAGIYLLVGIAAYIFLLGRIEPVAVGRLEPTSVS